MKKYILKTKAKLSDDDKASLIHKFKEFVMNRKESVFVLDVGMSIEEIEAFPSLYSDALCDATLHYSTPEGTRETMSLEDIEKRLR